MPLYKYRALTENGMKIDGLRDFNSKDEVLAFLSQNNQYPIEITEHVEGGRTLRFLDNFSKVKTKDLAVFCRQFYTMTNAGVIILNCLDILRVQTTNRLLRQAVGEMYEAVQKGKTLSEAMQDHPKIFPSLLTNMVLAGELSGTMDIVLDRMATHYEKENKINAKVKSAMIYPVVLAVIAIAMMIVMLVFVLPTFVGIFEGSNVALPLPTRMLLGLSDFVGRYILVILGAGVLGGYFGFRFVKSGAGMLVTDRLKLKLPVLKKLFTMIYTSRFTRTLSTLLASGTPMIRSLESVTAIIGNQVVQKGMLEAIEEVKKGVNLSVPIQNMGIFPPMVHHMIGIGEESGGLDDIMERTAAYYDEELEATITAMISLLEPLMILVMAVVIGGMVIAMMLPIFNMASTV